MKHLAVRCWAIVLLFTGACFSPQLEDGHITCGPNESCPPGLQCVGGVCRSGPQNDAGANATLTVALGGNSMGTVTSSPAGIDCGSTCAKAFPLGTAVTLTAAPTSGSIFVGWSGACSGTGTCSITLDASVTVTANFALDNSLVVVLAGNGSGIVSSNPAGINCGLDCNEQYPPNTMVVLTPSAATGSQFDGWTGGGCSGIGTCTVTTDVAKMVTATFSLSQHNLSVTLAGNGSGTVTSPAPSSLNCGTTCTAAVNYNAMVTLTATPATGSTFTGWSGGGCTAGSTAPCTVTVTAATNVTATFTLTQHLVTVTKAGNGQGTVSSTPTGINCGVDCSETYDYGTTVTLSATPATGSTFTGWSGGTCTGTASCVIPITMAESVTATFTLNMYDLTAAKSGNGVGTITSDVAGINCGTDCVESYNHGTVVTLTATPATGSTFVRWTGACTGSSTCVVTMTAAATATALFTLDTHDLTVQKTGTGAGTITGVGIACPGDCSETYDYGSVVTLTAAANAGSTFVGWGGTAGCSGTGTCVVTMNAAATVTAQFTLSTYLLTVTKAGTGAGSVASDIAGITCGADCTEVYGFGTQVTLTATPSAGSLFSLWTSGPCAGSTAASCPITIAADTSATASFTLTKPTLTVNRTGSGSCTVTSNIAGINCGVDCNEPYDYGTVVTLSASATSGSIFTGWTALGCSGTGTCDVTVDAAKTAVANCDLGTNALSVTKAGNGSGTVTSVPAGINCGVDCNENFTNGTAVTLTAMPATGSTFTGWSGGGCSGTGTCMITIGAPITITATFTLQTKTLMVTKSGTGGGGVTSSPAGINCGADCMEDYDYGTSVTLTATPNGTSTFVGWSGGGCSGTGTCVVPMTAATTVNAQFDPITYTLQVNKAGNGAGTVTAAGINCGADCSEAYNSGTNVSLSQTPATGSVFTGWSGAGCGGTGSCVVSMTAAQTVTATYTLTQKQLDVTIVGGSASGSVSSVPAGISCGADCSELYDYGTNVTLTATPSTGYSFNGWSGGGCSGTGTCQVSMVAAASVTATFSIKIYTLTVNTAGNGTGSVSSAPAGISCGADCTEDYNYNTQVTLTATPQTGTNFTGWSGACSGTGSCVVNMTAAASVTATFTLQQFQLSVSKSGTGSGGVTSVPSGINCGAQCSSLYDYGTVVVLTATPAAGSTFFGWLGATCSGTGTCTVTMTAATSVNPKFDPIPPNKAFVTSQYTITTIASISNADALCQAAANALTPPLGGTYKAWLSSASSNATTRIGSASGWVRTDGRPFANTKADLMNGNLFSPPRVNVAGSDIGTTNPFIATGTSSNGTYSNQGDCTNFTVTTGNITSGRTDASAFNFTNYGTVGCSASFRLLCLGVDNQAVVLPPAPTGSFRRVFMTTYAPDDGGLATADGACQTLATQKGLSGTYKAALPTTTASALSRFDTSSSAANWYRVDNMPVYASATAWTSGSAFDSAPNVSADGQTYYGAYGNYGGASSLTSVSASTSDNCNNWLGTVGATGRIGTAGFTTLATFLGVGSATMTCTNASTTIVCLQQ